MKRIPKRFNAMNHTIDVVRISQSKWKWPDWAYWESDKMRILVCAGKSSVAFHSFCHEMTHCLTELSGRPDLSADEGFVEVAGGLLAQILSTAEY